MLLFHWLDLIFEPLLFLKTIFNSHMSQFPILITGGSSVRALKKNSDPTNENLNCGSGKNSSMPFL